MSHDYCVIAALLGGLLVGLLIGFMAGVWKAAKMQALREVMSVSPSRIAPGLPRAAEHQPPPPGWVEYMVEKAKRESEQRS